MATFSGDMGLSGSIHHGLFEGRTTTSPNDGIIWGLNFPWGLVHSVEAHVGGDYVQSDSHVLVIGAMHIIFVFYNNDTYPQNPTPVGCQWY